MDDFEHRPYLQRTFPTVRAPWAQGVAGLWRCARCEFQPAIAFVARLECPIMACSVQLRAWAGPRLNLDG
eukprot:2732557-Alexandrium_andersonii.AAC.1